MIAGWSSSLHAEDVPLNSKYGFSCGISSPDKGFATRHLTFGGIHPSFAGSVPLLPHFPVHIASPMETSSSKGDGKFGFTGASDK